MNKFEYLAKVSEIDTLKTLKAKEKFIREQVIALQEIDGLSRWSYYITDKIINAITPRYKLLTKALKAYDGATNLPDKLIKVKERLESSFLDRFKNGKGTYIDFLDIFEFDTTLHFGSTDQETTIAIILMVGTAPLIHKIDINPYAPNRLAYMLATEDRYANGFKNILSLEDIKVTLGNRTDLTILNQALTEAYSNKPKGTAEVPMIMSRLNTIVDTMMSKLCP